MVQVIGGDLQPTDYLWPLTVIRDTLLRPHVETQISSEKLDALLRWHLSRLRKPWLSPPSSSSSSRSALSSSTLTIPETDAKVDVNEAGRSIALKLSDSLNLDEKQAYLLFASYSLHSIDDASPDNLPAEKVQDMEVERLTMWYSDERLAIPQIATAILQRAGEDGEWGDLARELRGELMIDPAGFMEGIFRGWSGIAQKQLEQDSTLESALLWATHQLQLQESLLDLLFIALFTTTDRTASISEGLIRGIVMSSFGTLQAKKEIWEDDIECQRLQIRIRDLMVVIAVESLCLAQIVSDVQYQNTLLQSRDRIHSVHNFISDYSTHLSSGHPGSEPTPIAILCLTWSIILQALPDELLPPSDTSGDESVAMQMASRALRLRSGLFPWIEEILSGPLFEPARDMAEEGDMAFRRNVVKDLLIGLSELVHVEAITDQAGLFRCWELLFGGGSTSTSLSISFDYWNSDFSVDPRRAILDKSRFPAEPLHLPRLLAALTGLSSFEASSTEAFESDPVTQVCRYFDAMSFTHAIDPSLLRFKDSNVEAAIDMVLPGGAVIPRGSKGTLLSQEPYIVGWRTKVSGWSFLVESLRVASGLPTTAPTSDLHFLSIDTLGISGQVVDVLTAGLGLLRSVLRSEVAEAVLSIIGENAGESILELVFAILQRGKDLTIATYAIDILQALLNTQQTKIWQALKHSDFFDTRRRGTFLSLVQTDSSRGEHGLTLGLLRLVSALTVSGNEIVRSALHLVFTEVWSQFSGWRYGDVARKYEIASLIIGMFDAVLRHPLGPDGISPSATYLIETLINSSSPLTYKPLVDVITQASPLATRLFRLRRQQYATTVNTCLDQSVALLSTLLRVSTTSASTLPKSLFAASAGPNVQLVDVLFDLVFAPSTLPSTTSSVLRLLRTYTESISTDPQRPSLAGLLRNAEKTCKDLAKIATTDGFADIKAAVWSLLSSIITTQPGCAAFCIEGLDGAIEQIIDHEAEIERGAHSLSAALSFCQSVLESPGASKAITTLRTNDPFWTAVYAISTRTIPSFHSAVAEAAEIQHHAYVVQSKANATGLLATELALQPEDGPDPKARSLVLSLFRNTSELQVAALSACYTTCEPELHERATGVVVGAGTNLRQLKTMLYPAEREYGPRYLYDGPVVREAEEALESLNFNWSLLDADIAYTKAFRSLAESASSWTEGDGLAAKAAVRAALVVAEELALENRGGDVMLAIQVERLSILGVLLETALEDAEADALTQLAGFIRTIIESHLFPPIISLRHDLPAIHKPVVRILFLLLQSSTSSPTADLFVNSVIEAGTIFALDAATILLEALTRGQPAHDLGLVIAVLCEISRSSHSHLWLDKVLEYGLIGQTLEVITRAKIVGGQTHVSSILLLHLALASQPASAEALAIAGLLSTYSDNAITNEAEAGRLIPGGVHSVHSAWCGMLLVVKALLSTLPNTASFARTDVIPFIRVSTAQILRAMSWDGETPLSDPAVKETEVVVDVFYGLSKAVGPVDGLLRDYGIPAISLLTSLRHALSHPRQLSTLLTPSEEDQQALEAELASVGDKDVNLVDSEKTPILANRTFALLRMCRTILLTLVIFTRAWKTLTSDEEIQGEILMLEESHSASSDPVGIVNDIFSLTTNLIDQLPTKTTENKDLLNQILETCALLSLSQLILRQAVQPREEADEDMDIDGPKRRVSLGKMDRNQQILRELEVDLIGMLPESNGNRFLVTLKGLADEAFGSD